MVHPYQDYFYNRLLGNNVTTSDAICCELCFNFIDGSRAAAYHSDGFKGAAAVEHYAHVGDVARVEVA